MLAVHRDAIDKHRFEREVGDAAMHGLTYSLADWKASEKLAIPAERFPLQSAPGTPSLPRPMTRMDSIGRQTAHQRPDSTATSVRLQRLSKPEQETATRASRLLHSMTPSEWVNFTKHGAPEAWQVARKGTKKGNTDLRRELAHISRLRDAHRKSGAVSVTPAFMSTRGSFADRVLAGSSSRGSHGDAALPSGDDVPDIPKAADRSRGHTPGSSPMRPSTSMSFSLLQSGASAEKEPALTPNTARRQHLAALMGTDSRPSSVYRVLKRRQPQAEFHMLWSAGPKRFENYRQNLENELLADKKAEQAKRRLLVKQVGCSMFTVRVVLHAINTETVTDESDSHAASPKDASGLHQHKDSASRSVGQIQDRG